MDHFAHLCVVYLSLGLVIYSQASNYDGSYAMCTNWTQTISNVTSFRITFDTRNIANDTGYPFTCICALGAADNSVLIIGQDFYFTSHNSDEESRGIFTMTYCFQQLPCENEIIRSNETINFPAGEHILDIMYQIMPLGPDRLLHIEGGIILSGYRNGSIFNLECHHQQSFDGLQATTSETPHSNSHEPLQGSSHEPPFGSSQESTHESSQEPTLVSSQEPPLSSSYETPHESSLEPPISSSHETTHNTKKSLQSALIVPVAIGVAALLIVGSVAVILIYCKRKRKKPHGRKDTKDGDSVVCYTSSPWSEEPKKSSCNQNAATNIMQDTSGITAPIPEYALVTKASKVKANPINETPDVLPVYSAVDRSHKINKTKTKELSVTKTMYGMEYSDVIEAGLTLETETSRQQKEGDVIHAHDNLIYMDDDKSQDPRDSKADMIENEVYEGLNEGEAPCLPVLLKDDKYDSYFEKNYVLAGQI